MHLKYFKNEILPLKDKLFRYALSYIKDKTESEDIVQEVFIRLSRIKDLKERFPPGKRSNVSYLFSIAHNLIIDRERSKKVKRAHLEQYRNEKMDSEETVSLETVVLAQEDLQRIKIVIMNLKPNWRKAFILNRFKFKTYREISIEMNVSVKQIEKYMKSALIKIREAAIDDKTVEQE